MRINDLAASDQRLHKEVADLLVRGFREGSPGAWPGLDLAVALDEVRESLEPGRLSRVAVDGGGAPLGWIGGRPAYDGRVWDLHPLVVRPDVRRRGIGRALVGDLEARVRERGGLTVLVGTDDEAGATSLAGVDLYQDLVTHLAGARVVTAHPLAFYRALGYTLVGVVPDANGPGKPDLLLAKRVG